METGKQKILITGASSGLGRELAHQFAQKGNVELILVARRKEALEKLDFYERVVRSVAREEAEVAGYYQIMDEDIKTTEAIEEATPVVEPVQQ